MSNIPLQISNSNKKILNEFEKITFEIIDRKDSDYFKISTFNTKDLPDHKEYSNHINIVPEFRHLFEKLDEIKENNCLYWFELESKEKALELNTLLDNYRSSKGTSEYKSVPATNGNDNSNVLYVGIRQGGFRKSDNLTNIAGRIYQHLGYYHSTRTQGLQFYEYAKGKDFNITLKVVKFDEIENRYLNIIEKMIAKELKPLAGRH